MPQLINKILYGQCPPLPTRTPKYLKDMIDKMLNKSANSRPSIDDLLAVREIQNHIRKLLDQSNVAAQLMHPKDLNQPGLTMVREKIKHDGGGNNNGGGAGGGAVVQDAEKAKGMTLLALAKGKEEYEKQLAKERAIYDQQQLLLKKELQKQKDEIERLKQENVMEQKRIAYEKQLADQKRLFIQQQEALKNQLAIQQKQIDDLRKQKLDLKQQNAYEQMKQQDLEYQKEKEKYKKILKSQQEEIELLKREKERILKEAKNKPPPRGGGGGGAMGGGGGGAAYNNRDDDKYRRPSRDDNNYRRPSYIYY